MIEWAEKSQSVILCEGFHDRNFWSGLLAHAGFTDPGIDPDRSARVVFKDPFGDTVSGKGLFGFASPTRRFIRVQPCFGRTKIPTALDTILVGVDTRRTSRIVVVVDPDTDAADAVGGLIIDGVLTSVRAKFPEASLDQNGDISLLNGETLVSLIRWECADPPRPGLPARQTLERLISAAIVEAYPERADCVEHWLQNRSEPPQPCGKEYSWSYMAGWYADHGCDDFLREIWTDPFVATALKNRLLANGSWRIVQAMSQ